MNDARAKTDRITRYVAMASILVASLLIIVKSAAWALSGSVSLLSSLADSTLDLAVSVISFLAVRYAAKPPDSEHRFGHGKAEAFAGLFQAGIVALSALLIAIEAGRQLLAPQPIKAGAWALAAMLISISLTGVLVLAQTWALARTRSLATSGDRAHYLSDFGSNFAVILGIIGATWFKLPALDALIGLGVAAALCWGSWRVAADAANQLMDRELPDDIRAQILALAQDDPQILGLHSLRSRALGSHYHIELRLVLDPLMRLVDVHDIVERAQSRLLAAFPTADLHIQVEPQRREPIVAAHPAKSDIPPATVSS